MTVPTPHQILHPAGWKAAKGYANGIVAQGRTVYVGGQIGWTGDQIFEAKDLPSQVRQTLQNVVDVVREAGGVPEHLVKMTWFITSKSDYLANVKAVGDAYRSVMGKHFPAMAMVEVSALIEDEAQVEIEAVAVVPA
ncbi:RidA family protein [Pseudaminobacter arsenicus]|uniref:RidA family protein n=1 Tax=Borborobacter arsenicus TaxID=1851146 RepID=A0A432V604_9HYPH|nr:RidA family protein [Pseudaminobacter arsenicus]RUM97513.1 RidA family protein [Pseudaminobacter arsenicus]